MTESKIRHTIKIVDRTPEDKDFIKLFMDKEEEESEVI